MARPRRPRRPPNVVDAVPAHTSPPYHAHAATWPSWRIREPPLQLVPVYKGASLLFLAQDTAAVATITAAGELDLPRVLQTNRLSRDLH
jgi:hypothetical protein